MYQLGDWPVNEAITWLRHFGPAAALIYAALVFGVVLVNRGRWTNLHTQFERTLFRAMSSGATKTFEDVLRLYRGVYQNAPSLDHRHGVTSRLRASLVKFVNGTFGATFQGGRWHYPNFTPEVHAAWRERLTQFITESEEAASFSELPPLEQNIFKDIMSFLDSNDAASANRKLSELADTIRSRDSGLRAPRQ